MGPVYLNPLHLHITILRAMYSLVSFLKPIMELVIMDTVQENEKKEVKPWDWMDLTDNAFSRALTSFNKADTNHRPSCAFNSVEEEKFYYYLLGRGSVQVWDLHKPYIITSGEFNNQRLSTEPKAHKKVYVGKKEAARLSLKHKDTPFYLWGAVAAFVNGESVPFSPALHAMEVPDQSSEENQK